MKNNNKKELNYSNFLIEIENLRYSMKNLFDDIIAGNHTPRDIMKDKVDSKWLEGLPSCILDKFDIPKEEFNPRRFAEQEANKMFEEDIINDINIAHDDDEMYPYE